MHNKLLSSRLMLSATVLLLLFSNVHLASGQDANRTAFPSPDDRTTSKSTSNEVQESDLLSPASKAPSVPDTPQKLPIKKDDEIVIEMAGEAWGGSFKIPESGNINLQFIGTVNVLGKTIDELRKELHGQLKPNYYTDPNLRINFESFGENRILVMGEVGEPSHVEIPRGEGVMDALVESKSITKNSKRLKIYVFRKTNNDTAVYHADWEQYVQGDLSQNIPLKDGDLVYVRANFWPHWDTLDSLLDTIGFASGTTDRFRRATN